MTIRLSIILYSVAIAGALALAPAAAMAQAKTAKACEDEWAAKKADIQKSGQTKKAFVAQCRSGAAAAPAKPAEPVAAKPAAAPAKPAATPAAAPAGATGKPGREAMVARERACGVAWKADKAAGKIEKGMTWPKYWSDCDKRKKAEGM